MKAACAVCNAKRSPQRLQLLSSIILLEGVLCYLIYGILGDRSERASRYESAPHALEGCPDEY